MKSKRGVCDSEMKRQRVSIGILYKVKEELCEMKRQRVNWRSIQIQSKEEFVHSRDKSERKSVCVCVFV